MLSGRRYLHGDGSSFCARTIHLLAGVMLAGVALAPCFREALADEPASAKTGAAAAWDTASTLDVAGLKVSLSTPVLVARSKGFLWFPTLSRLKDGTLLALMSNYADEHVATSTAEIAWSIDGGLSWSKPVVGQYGDCHVHLPEGDLVLLPYYLYPRQDGMSNAYQRVRQGKQEIELVKDALTVTGWPRADKSFAPNLGLSGFVFNGQSVALADGGYLATLYGHFKDTTRYALVVAESRDAVQWKIRATIADEHCKLQGGEGPCEAALCRLKDGRLFCVFRLASNVPFGQTYSSDEGRTWSEPVAAAGPFSVQPSLAIAGDGMVVLSGGRPGLFAWINPDGTGQQWDKINIEAHHDACHPKEPIGGRTSSYTEVVALDDTHLLYIYDRIPHSWSAIPKDSAETNSVWVVRISVGEQTR